VADTQLTVVGAADAAGLVGDIERTWASGGAALVLEPGARPLSLADTSTTPDTVLVVATSGTTRSPRLVELSDSALEAAVTLTNEAVGAAPGDRWLCCLPVAHVGGLMTLLRSRALGTSAVIHERFDVERMRAERSARFVSLVPTMLHRLLSADVDLTGFDRVLVGGAAVDSGLLQRARDRGVAVTTTYGMTETCGGVVYDGLPLPGVEVDLREGGRIALTSPTLMSGYLNDRVATDAVLRGGWFETNDAGAFDEEGRLRVLGRLDRVIVTGGKKVDPAEVEAVLSENPKVAGAWVRGENDDEWGQKVVALVVPRDPEDPPALEDLLRFLEGRLSRHMWPRDLTVVDRLPKT